MLHAAGNVDIYTVMYYIFACVCVCVIMVINEWNECIHVYYICI